MTVTSLHKKWFLFFVCSLIPSYWFADWRYETNRTVIQQKYQREEALHQSTDKLLKNCADIRQKDNDQFDASHQICEQGLKIHAQTDQQIDALSHEKMTTDSRRYTNFAMCVSIINLMGYLAFRARRLLDE